MQWSFGLLIALVVSAWSAYTYGHKHGSDSVQAKWEADKVATIAAQRDKEAALQANMDKLRTEKNNELARLNRHVRNLSDSLRDRPERPAVPASAADGDGASGCTGATVYKQDGEFLIREASRADQLRLALIACQAAYREARK